MKKFLATILAIVYLSTSMGTTVHLHYCMGKLVAWGLLDHTSKDCTFCGMQNKPAADECMVTNTGCCRDEQMQIKSSKDVKLSQNSLELAKITVTIADVPYSAWIDPFVISPVLVQSLANGPPLTGDVPVFLRNCNFRI